MARIEQKDKEVRAYLSLCPERALAQAKKVDAAIAAGEALAPLAGVPVAVKDVIMTRGNQHHVRLAHPGEFHCALRCHRCRTAGGRRSCRPWQDELRRIRHGLLDGKLQFLSHPQSSRFDTRARRIKRWFGRSRCCEFRHRRLGIGHRWVNPSARVVLRSRRNDGNLRQGFTLWFGGVRLVARPHRTFWALGAAMWPGAANHRRTRCSGLHLRRAARRRLCGRLERRHPGNPRRGSDGVSQGIKFRNRRQHPKRHRPVQ